MAMPRVARAFEEYAEDVPGLKAAMPRVAHDRFHASARGARYKRNLDLGHIRFHASARSARDSFPLPWQCKGHIR